MNSLTAVSASPLAASPPQCDEPKARACGHSLHPSALSPPRPTLGPLPDQRGEPYVTLSLLHGLYPSGLLGRDLSWLIPALPAKSPFRPAPQGLWTCAWPLAAPAVASAYAKYTFGKIFLLSSSNHLFPIIDREGKHMGGKVDRLTIQALSLLDHCMQ